MSSGGGRGAQVKSLILVNVLACRLFIWQRHPSPWRHIGVALKLLLTPGLVPVWFKLMSPPNTNTLGNQSLSNKKYGSNAPALKIVWPAAAGVCLQQRSLS